MTWDSRLDGLLVVLSEPYCGTATKSELAKYLVAAGIERIAKVDGMQTARVVRLRPFYCILQLHEAML
jgi:hypothetical protein